MECSDLCPGEPIQRNQLFALWARGTIPGTAIARHPRGGSFGGTSGCRDPLGPTTCELRRCSVHGARLPRPPAISPRSVPPLPSRTQRLPAKALASKPDTKADCTAKPAAERQTTPRGFEPMADRGAHVTPPRQTHDALRGSRRRPRQPQATHFGRVV